MAIIHLTRTNDIVDGLFRPIATNLTCESAGRWIASHAADLPGYVEARWTLTPEAPVSIERQIANKMRRLTVIAHHAGRALNTSSFTRNGALCSVLLAR
jgi:hypothetical protein